MKLRKLFCKWPAMPKFICILAIFCVLAVTSGCQREEKDPEDEKITQKELDRLRSLPYLDYSKKKAKQNNIGVVQWIKLRSYPGYNLFISRGLCLAELIDADGTVIHSWRHPECEFWQDFELLPDGDLLVVENSKTSYLGKGRKIFRLAWNGEVVWRQAIPADHEIHYTPGKPLMTFQFMYHQIPTINPRIHVMDNYLTTLSLGGQLLESHSLFEILNNSSDVFKFQDVAPNRDAFKPHIDLLHSNTIEWINKPHLETKNTLYSPNNILVTIRHQDTITIIDWNAKKAIWSWGQGQISGPHDATVLENGNILLFDNGLNRGWSRVIELNPSNEEIVWEYKAQNPKDFYTSTRGTNQRLPNQNTLITDSESGHVFEVTPEGDIVWEYYSSHLNEKGERATIIRMRRYERSFIQKILDSHRDKN